MILSSQPYTYSGKVVTRQQFILILHAGLASHSFRFVRQAALNWLAVYPGDLETSLLLAQALAGDGKKSQAISILNRLVRSDPEYTDAWQLLAVLHGTENPGEASQAASNVIALGKGEPQPGDSLDWSLSLCSANKALKMGELENAERMIHQSLGMNPNSALAAVFHLTITRAQQDEMTIYRLVDLYHSRWPDCLQFCLCLAEAQLKMGDETHAVELLHHCVANDTAGQVPERIWGREHSYRVLWSDSLELELDIPVPAEVAALMGWNRLPAAQQAIEATSLESPDQVDAETEISGEPGRVNAEAKIPDEPEEAPAPLSEITPENSPVLERPEHKLTRELEPVEKEFERIAKRLKRPSLARSDTRFPMYVIFSTRAGLARQYGMQTALVIENEMANLVEIVKRRPGWGALVFIADDAENATRMGIQPADAADPWKLKLALFDLDKRLAAKGSMIGALLIVGGPEVIPFHHLPNPTDDVDDGVVSDNPYSTLDSNYFVPEWPVGRLTGETGPDAGLILEQLRRMKVSHNQFRRSETWFERIFFYFNFLWKLKQPRGKSARPFGYAAAVWRRPSEVAFRPVGEARSILISPPVSTGGFDPMKITDANLAYYNLHGLIDTAEWYGQRDLSDAANVPDYPVALGPKDLVKNGRAPAVVFTAACYGGHIEKKAESEALALRFLSIGSQAVVGSTGIAYGSVTTPLIGADLLANLFWKNMRAGLVAGEALMLAKIETAREMIQRQGFLDGEDQKTLISFVLYGDPFARLSTSSAKSTEVVRLRPHPNVKTICDRQDGMNLAKAVSPETLAEVKRVVEVYLPGLDNADILITTEHEKCAGEHHHCPTAQLGQKGKPLATGARTVVTISKKVKVREHTHYHYARATLNTEGKMVKLALSR
ncbi:MAG TPA: C25 family cysteine peptidase [Levilinea sp.]|nr:C25 family cysteine peptidase [Levilinea sp.]